MMVTKQQIRIIIDAEEKVSKVAKEAEKALNKLGNAGKKGLDAINKGSSKIHSAISKISSYVEKARNKFNELRNSSSSAGSAIRSAIGTGATAFGKLITSSNTAKIAMEKIKSVSDGIKTKITSLTTKISNFASTTKSRLAQAFSIGNIKSKLSSVGTSIDKLKLKIKQLSAESKSLGGSFGFLNNALSMTVGMIGYDLVNGFVESARAAVNANGQLDYFGGRLKMSASETENFRAELDQLQTSFKKVNMKAVGASAEEMAVKLNLPKESLLDLTETTAVMSSAFVKEGRSQEDAILAVSDALDGQFKRLQELGISQDMLKNNGWSGDIEDKTSLLQAMKKTLDDMGFTQTAKDITNLDEAYQALTVSGGILLEKILVPLTPVLMQIMDAVMGVMDTIGSLIESIQNAWNSLPEWAQIGIAVAAVAVAVGIAVAAFGGLEAILLSLAASFAPVIAAITGISLPIVAVVAAIGLIVAAVYELGKAFGWWHDVGSMFEAIQAGIMKMWNAFINHPDVQATISAIVDMLTWLAGAIGNTIDWVLQLFGVSSDSKWDIVTDIINAIGGAWDIFSGKIKFVIGIVQNVANAFMNFYNGTLVPLGEFLSDVLTPVWQALLDIWNTVEAQVQGLISVFDQYQSGQIGLLDVIGAVMSALWNIYLSVTSNILSLILEFASKLLSGAIKAGKNFFNGIVNQVKKVPGRVYNYIKNTLSRTKSGLQNWVNTAKQKARDFVNGIVNALAKLAGRVYNKLMSVVGKITSAGRSWVNAAKQKAKDIVDSVGNILSNTASRVKNALSGVKDAILKPFRDAYNTAKDLVGKIANLGAPSAGGDEPVAGGDDNAPINPFVEKKVTIENNETMDVVLSGKSDLNLNINLEGLPENVDENTIVRIISEIFDDPDWKNALIMDIVKSALFQKADAKEKYRLSSNNKRARGVGI